MDNHIISVNWETALFLEEKTSVTTALLSPAEKRCAVHHGRASDLGGGNSGGHLALSFRRNGRWEWGYEGI